MFTFSRDFVMSRFWKDLFFTFIGERYPCALSSDNDIHVFCLDLIPLLSMRCYYAVGRLCLSWYLSRSSSEYSTTPQLYIILK